MKTVKTIFILLLCYFSVFSQQKIDLKEKGFIDIAIHQGSFQDYINIPADKIIKSNFGITSRNFESFVLVFKAWNLMGELVINPILYWELNRTYLSTDNHFVKYSTISKYPDLVKRYQSIMPNHIDIILNLELFPYDKVFAFKITNNDLGYSTSRSTKFPVFPTSPLKWRNVMSNYTYDIFSGFDSNPSDELELKKILAGTTGVSLYSIEMHVKWPDNEINEIADLYAKYESGKEKPPSEQVKEELAAEDLGSYTKNDEWSEAFEDELKDVETFSDKDKKIIGLKTPDRTVITFEMDKYYNIRKIDNTSFFELSYYDKNALLMRYAIVDKRGNVQKINGHSEFNRVSSNNDGNIILEIDLTEWKLITETTMELDLDDEKIYESFGQASDKIQNAFSTASNRAEVARIEAERKSEARSASGGEIRLYFDFSTKDRYYVTNILRLTTNEQLKTINSQEGYTIIIR